MSAALSFSTESWEVSEGVPEGQVRKEPADDSRTDTRPVIVSETVTAVTGRRSTGVRTSPTARVKGRLSSNGYVIWSEDDAPFTETLSPRIRAYPKPALFYSGTAPYYAALARAYPKFYGGTAPFSTAVYPFGLAGTALEMDVIPMLRRSHLDCSDRFAFLLTEARTESFEDGVESVFVRELAKLYRESPSDTTRHIMQFISDPRSSETIASEVVSAVRTFAEKEATLRILARGIAHDSPMVRDAAANALSLVDNDDRARDIVAKAAAKETNPVLRSDMADLLASWG